MLELDGISKSYTNGKITTPALKSVNFKLRKGDFIIIRGPSGSGKSTLLNIMGLLDEPTTGKVLLNQQQIAYTDFDRLAVIRSRSISFIFQSFNLNPVLTLEENAMVPLMIRSDVSKEEKKRRVSLWLDNVGLSKEKHRRPDEISGGQRQRVAIARAMVTQPEIVIADEPTASLDSKTTRSILALMKDLNQNSGTAFVFATHDPVLDEYSNEILHITDGVLNRT